MNKRHVICLRIGMLFVLGALALPPHKAAPYVSSGTHYAWLIEPDAGEVDRGLLALEFLVIAGVTAAFAITPATPAVKDKLSPESKAKIAALISTSGFDKGKNNES